LIARLANADRYLTRKHTRTVLKASTATRLPVTREVVERGLPELLAAGGANVAAGAGLGEQLAALQPAGFRALLAAIHAVTRDCLRHSCS